MKSGFTLVLFILGLFTSVFSQSEEKMHRVYFFGNLADVENTASFTKSLQNQFETESTPFTLIVNGDLVDQKIEESDLKSVQHIFNLVDMIEGFPSGNLFIIPGDRDWNLSLIHI